MSTDVAKVFDSATEKVLVRSRLIVVLYIVFTDLSFGWLTVILKKTYSTWPSSSTLAIPRGL